MNKKLSVVALFAAFVVGALFIRANQPPVSADKVVADSLISFSPEVKAVIDAKCYGCHNPEGKSQKAKDKLLWDDLAKLPKEELVAKVDEIIEVLEKGEMPPKKFLEMFPDKKLTDDESQQLKAWAEESADALLK